MKISNSNINISFKSTLINFIILVFLIGSLQMLIPLASAAGDDAEFNSIEVTATPRVQGMGGEITINVKANFFGGCCYHLYAYDVAASLQVPDENVKIVGSLPSPIKNVDAQPGGQPTSVSFQWRIAGYVPGNYELVITVTTGNCGSISDIIIVTITEGASISNPDIYPRNPSINEDISIAIAVNCGREETHVEATSLFLVTTKQEYDLERLSAKNETLYIGQGYGDNATHAQLENIGNGEQKPMHKLNFTDKWRAILDGYSDEIEIYFWFVVITSDGKNTTSSVYNLEIEDLEQREFILSSVIWLTFSSVLIGSILIIGLWLRILKKLEKPTAKKGFLSIGGKYYETPYQTETSKASKVRKKMKMMRLCLIILFLIIAIIFIIWAIYADLFSELFTRTMEG